MDIDDFTRVFLPGTSDRTSHLLTPWDTANSTVAALCGQDPEPTNWLGTGTQDEWEDAATRATCTRCKAAMDYMLANRRLTAPDGADG